MIEQQLAERFRAVVVDEPPFGEDPEELVDRLLRRRRRRQGSAAALGVAVIATLAVALASWSPPARVASPAPPPAPPTPPPTTLDSLYVSIAATAPPGRTGEFTEHGRYRVVRAVPSFLLDAAPTDQGTLWIRRDEEVLFEADLAKVDSYLFEPAEPVYLEPGQRVVVAVACARTEARTCRVDVTYSAPPAPR